MQKLAKILSFLMWQSNGRKLAKEVSPANLAGGLPRTWILFCFILYSLLLEFFKPLSSGLQTSSTCGLISETVSILQKICPEHLKRIL